MTEPAPYAPRRGTSAMAVTSLVLGIIGVLCCPGFLIGLGAVVTGLLARRDARDANGAVVGAGVANVGLALGLLSIVVGAMFWILYAAGVTSFKLEYG